MALRGARHLLPARRGGEGEVGEGDSTGTSDVEPSAEAETGDSKAAESSDVDSSSEAEGGDPEGSESSTETEGGDSEDAESSDADSSDESAEEDSQQEDGATADSESDDDADAAGGSGEKQDAAPKAAVAVKTMSSAEASKAVTEGDALATERTVGSLNLPELSGRRAPTPAQISNFLQQLRQGVVGGETP